MPVVLYSEESGLGSGDANVSLRGTGSAVPRGIEALFQYNNLLLNDRSVIDKYRIISIDGLDDPDVRDSRDENPADDGETPNFALYGGRTLAINGRIEAYELNKLRDMQQALRTAFADLSRERPLHFLTGDGDLDHYISCKKFSKNQWGEEQKHLNHFFRDFLITVRASDPRFYRKKSTVVTLDADGTDQQTISIFGNYKTAPKIRIYGAITGASVENIDTGITISLKSTSTIANGDFYEIDIPNRSLIDNNGVNKFSALDSSSEWLYLEPGANQIKVDGTSVGVNSKFEITYRDAWI